MATRREHGADSTTQRGDDAAARGTTTVREAGRRGGERTRDAHGPEYYREIGAKGGKAGGAKGGRKGGARVRALVAAAKRALRRGGRP